tara:strand:+ start:80 stop:199 length:120 start_codon:yes stop_codon:yes gene_type:complete
MEFTEEEIRLIKLALQKYDDNYFDKRMEIAELLYKLEED